ncbi:hypothetical protein C1H57_24840 [Clostridium sp. 2-1]|nr:hypothetical protein C1H57_24840 [Clostridium sp. 2-1]
MRKSGRLRRSAVGAGSLYDRSGRFHESAGAVSVDQYQAAGGIQPAPGCGGPPYYQYGNRIRGVPAGYLLDLMKVAESNEVTLPLPMKELAAFLGTAPETLSRKIGKFEEEGLLERNGKRIRILQPDTLNDIE